MVNSNFVLVGALIVSIACLSYDELLFHQVSIILLLGIKECGSLSNPKPFIVRFRMMCMAEVLWFAVNNGLRSECCLSVINAVNEPLVNMLEEIIQVTLRSDQNSRVKGITTECLI